MGNKEVYKELFDKHDTTRAANYSDMKKRLEEWLGDLKQYERVLDVGCGNGKYTLVFDKECKKVIGVDLHDNLKGKIRDFRTMNAMNLEFPDNTFDLVFCSGVAHHTKSPYKVFDELIRVCKKDGVVYIAVYKDNWYFKTIHLLRPLFKKFIPFSWAKKLSFDVDNLYADYVFKYKKEDLDAVFSWGLSVEGYWEGYKLHRYKLRKL